LGISSVPQASRVWKNHLGPLPLQKVTYLAHHRSFPEMEFFQQVSVWTGERLPRVTLLPLALVVPL
jgi:hypothetical protein